MIGKECGEYKRRIKRLNRDIQEAEKSLEDATHWKSIRFWTQRLEDLNEILNQTRDEYRELV